MSAAVRVVLLTAVAVLALAALSRAPYTPPDADDAVLRASWRMSVSARENCRVRTPDELESLPVHMRTPEVCEPDPATYALVLRLDEAPADTIPLTRGGVKHDRPLFVLEERALPPGPHRVRVDLRRRSERTGAELLARLDTTVTLDRGTVRLVTLAPGGGRLLLRSSPER